MSKSWWWVETDGAMCGSSNYFYRNVPQACEKLRWSVCARTSKKKGLLHNGTDMQGIPLGRWVQNVHVQANTQTSNRFAHFGSVQDSKIASAYVSSFLPTHLACKENLGSLRTLEVLFAKHTFLIIFIHSNIQFGDPFQGSISIRQKYGMRRGFKCSTPLNRASLSFLLSGLCASVYLIMRKIETLCQF